MTHQSSQFNSESASGSWVKLPDIEWGRERVSRIMLGTVQLGMDYGIANVGGQPDLTTAAAIVETAWTHGVRHFDTAQAYGTSETVLGQAFRDLGVRHEAHVVSKLNPKLDPRDPDAIRASVERSMERLGVDRLWCMMLHVAGWLAYWDMGLGDALRCCRDAGRVEHLGVSLNDPNEAASCLAHPDIDILQVACNAWDRRMLDRRVLETARANGQICCVRSIYLKGLLTLPPQEVARRLPIAADAAERWHACAARWGLDPVALAVRFALSLDAPLVIGAETPDQVRDTLCLARTGPLPAEILADLDRVMRPVVNDRILTPRQWEDLPDAILMPRRGGAE